MTRSDSGTPALRRSRFVTFDGSFASENVHQRPDRYRHLEVDLGKRKRIARGAGLSYVAASFGGASIVQEMSAFDRLLAFDPARRTLRVEAGTPIGAIVSWAARRDLCVPVVPGYPAITVGGCIAADVHGKNPMRDGTFGEWVESLTLFSPAFGFRSIDRSRNVDQFHATCGGFGLTGLVVDATLRLATRPAPNVRVRQLPMDNLGQAIDAIDAARDCDFAYSWHDGSARGRTFGRGVLFLGAWTDEPCARVDDAYRPMNASQRASWPLCLWNGPSVRLANAWFRHRALGRRVHVKSAFDAAFPFARQTLYHRFFGSRGLAEMQVLIPDESVYHFVRSLKVLVERHDPPLVMLSVKRFRGQSHALGMAGTGTLFALDFVRSESTSRFAADFDALLLDSQGQPNVAKDSRLPVAIAARSLPGYASFARLLRTCDADRLYESELSRRLHL
jgi:decaprenylphospho-beta-D-ribofuranose 2-oxidase